MGKRKLQQYSEIDSFDNVFQVKYDRFRTDYHMKGLWRKNHFANDNPIVLELGCGKGEYSIGLATRFRNKNFIGIDIKGARIWRGSKTAIDTWLENVAFVRTLIEQIDSVFGEKEVDEVWITFPDPQLKKRREKKRLTSPEFLKKYGQILKENGIVHLKTDSVEMHRYSKETVEEIGHEILLCTEDLYGTVKDNDILEIKTFYEEKYLKQQKPICYLKFRYLQTALED